MQLNILLALSIQEDNDVMDSSIDTHGSGRASMDSDQHSEFACPPSWPLVNARSSSPNPHRYYHPHHEYHHQHHPMQLSCTSDDGGGCDMDDDDDATTSDTAHSGDTMADDPWQRQQEGATPWRAPGSGMLRSGSPDSPLQLCMSSSDDEGVCGGGGMRDADTSDAGRSGDMDDADDATTSDTGHSGNTMADDPWQRQQEGATPWRAPGSGMLRSGSPDSPLQLCMSSSDDEGVCGGGGTRDADTSDAGRSGDMDDADDATTSDTGHSGDMMADDPSQRQQEGATPWRAPGSGMLRSGSPDSPLQLCMSSSDDEGVCGGGGGGTRDADTSDAGRSSDMMATPDDPAQRQQECATPGRAPGSSSDGSPDQPLPPSADDTSSDLAQKAATTSKRGKRPAPFAVGSQKKRRRSACSKGGPSSFLLTTHGKRSGPFSPLACGCNLLRQAGVGSWNAGCKEHAADSEKCSTRA